MNNFFSRYWIYQQERFPLVEHGPLIAAFSFCAVSFSAQLRGVNLPSLNSVIVAFISSLIFFLQLRIADEFKDFEEDSRYRPYRPVPRGLVSLKELGWIGAICAVIQLTLALWFYPKLALLLFLTWSYLALMSHEFFMRDWLKAHPFTYLWSHMLIMPLVDLYATACDWLPTQGTPSDGLFWFLIASFCNGVVIEIGRKIRAPMDEEKGVETYSFLWGRPKAVLAWLIALALTATSVILAAINIHFASVVAIILITLLVSAGFVGRKFLNSPEAGRGKRFELLSGIWTLALYLSLGVGPIVQRLIAEAK